MPGRTFLGVSALALVIAACTGIDQLPPDDSEGGAGGDSSVGSSSSATPTHDASTSTGASHDASTSSNAGTCTVSGVAGECITTAACAALGNHISTPGHCPGAANIQCCTPESTTTVCNPDPKVAPEPNVGFTQEAVGEGGCPDGMVKITTFCIDKYEASLVRGDTGDPWSPYFNPENTEVIAVSVEGAVPQGYIDGIQAGEACLNAGKRLCTDAEWLRACRGPSDSTYPYGNTRETGVCNDHRDVHPAVEYFGTTATWIYSQIDNACLDQLPDSLAPTGSHPGCVTAEGVFDMMGNLHEWTADPAGTFRGGYYVDTVRNGPGCSYVTTAHDSSHWDYSTGFRCCADL